MHVRGVCSADVMYYFLTETEFHLTVPPAGSGQRKPRSLVFRAPSLEAKLAWEDQVHKQM